MSLSDAWWRDAVIYQIYVRSFADSGGDGIGDLAGIRSRLDYVQGLGVDGIWLNPCYPSPQKDHGYDVADYTDIEPTYGDLTEFDALLADCHDRGLKLLMDVVPNHCSSAHPWFVGAVAAGPGSRERARFLFREGRGPGGEEPPNNWQGMFGGPAWTRVAEADGKPGQWYLHLFDPAQPDFDWRNPEVGDLFEDVLRFWFERGVDGFRIDVAHGLVKDGALPDGPMDEQGHPKHNAAMWNQPEVHEVYRRWRRIADSYAGDLVLVGEIWVDDVADLAHYLRPDELPQAFFFDLLIQPWRAAALRSAIDRGLTQITATGAVTTWTLSNHDVHRVVTRYGQEQPPEVDRGADPANSTRARGPVDVALGTRRARAALLLLLALPGSVYLYQGEELGLPEVMDLPDDARTDPIWKRSHHTEYGRDGCRVPLPWTAAGASFGFSPTDDAAPSWLPQPNWFAEYAVDAQEHDPDSVLRLYRTALRLRRDLAGDLAQPLEWVEVPGREDVFAFRRGALTCVVVCGSEPFEAPVAWGELALGSAAGPTPAHRLVPPESAAWLHP